MFWVFIAQRVIILTIDQPEYLLFRVFIILCPFIATYCSEYLSFSENFSCSVDHLLGIHCPEYWPEYLFIPKYLSSYHQIIIIYNPDCCIILGIYCPEVSLSRLYVVWIIVLSIYYSEYLGPYIFTVLIFLSIYSPMYLSSYVLTSWVFIILSIILSVWIFIVWCICPDYLIFLVFRILYIYCPYFPEHL